MSVFFTSFKWALPLAFSDAVNLCRFEEGDVLYDSTSAYDDSWKEAKKNFGFSLQVRYPARSSAVGKGAGAVFENNWSSEVRIDVYKNLRQKKSVTTTQGRLYTALWRNDLKVLDSNESPVMPIRLKQVTKLLKDVPNELSNRATNHLTFVLPRDMANPVSKAKQQKIYRALSAYLYSEPIIISPLNAGLPDSENIAPTIDVALFPVTLSSESALIDLIKSAVYTPAKNAKVGMFRMVSHGFIIDSVKT